MTSGCFQIKSALKGRRFQDTEEIQKKKKKKKVTTALKAIPQQDFQKRFQDRWAKRTAAQRE
jgi:hypothetical protein